MWREGIHQDLEPGSFGAGSCFWPRVACTIGGIDNRIVAIHAPDRQQPKRRGPRLGLHHEPTGAEGRAGGLGGEEGVGFWSGHGYIRPCGKDRELFKEEALTFYLPFSHVHIQISLQQ